MALGSKWPLLQLGITHRAKSGTTANHPIRQFALAGLNGAYRQYTGHPAAADWPAEVDPKQTLSVSAAGFS